MTQPAEKSVSENNKAAKSAKSDINEEREFQLRLLEIQRSYDTVNSFLTTVQAVSYSFVVTILTIVFTVRTTSLGQTVSIVAIVVFSIVGGASTIIMILFHRRTMRKQINGVRNEFILKD